MIKRSLFFIFLSAFRRVFSAENCKNACKCPLRTKSGRVLLTVGNRDCGQNTPIIDGFFAIFWAFKRVFENSCLPGLCRHFISPPRFMFCFSERMLSAIPFFLLFFLLRGYSLFFPIAFIQVERLSYSRSSVFFFFEIKKTSSLSPLDRLTQFHLWQRNLV